MSKYKVTLETHSVEDTQCFGNQLGQWVKHSGNPLCIALIGDLGTGKTHMSQGIAKGLGVMEEITSPTFSLMNTYMTLLGEIYHFDLYRMDYVSELENIGFYEFTEDQISIVEWADKFIDELPNETLWIRIISLDDCSRKITLESNLLDVETLSALGGKYVVGN
ncbi:tRNA (adenosine(37)-N6)-threonylcarbamoyltransferase complex ATPase subunit type 1 TsaE [uncultured Veillonella sp.]|uniref:tRNA (adenosine(37)-N6)-threonylcarbamoyltransferase complex ATPase subunit type 1 TsaE n=1 Tax=uncultured Veillonella sp. TaxID=159268 RepID=UPI0025D94FC6|nr:tRNA (adenosine(37)-N6)-threonylcarbamoyltransferase complex ATPase subunit type 1 TsaE [uncultured Veillonella sp.]